MDGGQVDTDQGLELALILQAQSQLCGVAAGDQGAALHDRERVAVLKDFVDLVDSELGVDTLALQAIHVGIFVVGELSLEALLLRVWVFAHQLSVGHGFLTELIRQQLHEADFLLCEKCVPFYLLFQEGKQRRLVRRRSQQICHVVRAGLGSPAHSDWYLVLAWGRQANPFVVEVHLGQRSDIDVVHGVLKGRWSAA